ncbi:MAG: PocR ligand-binding domain-containing protein [Candidatus Limivicinus sp.]|jgi:two-component system response regulator YesN
MAAGLFALVSEAELNDVLGNLQAFTGLAIQLIDDEGSLLKSYGQSARYCSLLKSRVFDRAICFQLHMKAGQKAQELGEAYIFSCHAGLNHIAFPLISRGELLGSVIIGPFLMDRPDTDLISDLAEKYEIPTSLALELYEEAENVIVYSPAKVNQLKKLVDHLLLPLIPGEQEPLLRLRQKMSQQSHINETIQIYKEQNTAQSLNYLYRKENELLAKVRSGTVTEVKALLNDLIGYVLFSEGAQLETIKVRAIELTTLLSRVAIDGGATPDSTYKMNSSFISRLYLEKNLDDLCMLMQKVLESFMEMMFNEKDKGNPYIRKALRYMSDNYSEHLELNQVADYVNLSPSYFSSLFRSTVGMSFSEQLCRIRVEESKKLLLLNKYSLADIAAAMGFPDQSYYSKVFKRIVGITPSKFRC